MEYKNQNVAVLVSGGGLVGLPLFLFYTLRLNAVTLRLNAPAESCPPCALPRAAQNRYNEQAAEQRQRVQQNLQNAELQQEEKSATIQKRQESTAQAEAQKGFRTKALLDRHFSKHQLEYGTISEGKYLQIANEITSEPLSDDVVQLERSDGSISKYRYSTNDFLVVNKDGTIRTLFKPEKGGEYWQNELDRN